MLSFPRTAIGPWFLVAALTVALALGFASAQPHPLDDHFSYQRFLETLAEGRLDLSIPGFHGPDIVAVPLYLLTRSPIAQIEFQVFCALLLPLLAFLAGRVLFLRSNEVVLFTVTMAMMPFLSFVALRGWTGPSLFAFLLLSVACVRRFPWISAVLLALSIFTKPFAVAFLPLLLVLHGGTRRARLAYTGLALGLPALYALAQWVSVGHIIVGAHDETQFTIWQGPVRIALNAAHALQILFSVHNYYFPDPSLTGPGNLLHTTPLLIFLGLASLLSRESPWPLRQRRALLLGVLLGIGLNLPLSHMDHFYMESGVVLLAAAAIPLLARWPLWIALVLATLHFQWFYFFLQYRDVFALTAGFFAVPALVDALALGWLLLHLDVGWVELRSLWER